MKYIKKATLIAGFSLLVTTHLLGCATSFAGNSIPTIERYPVPPAPTPQGLSKPTALLEVTWHTNEVLKEAPSFVEVTRDMAQSSKLFSAVTTSRDIDWDYRLEIDMTNEGDMILALCLGTISGITLTILPAYAQDNYILKATVYDSKNAVVKSYQYEDHVESWIQLFLLPFAPATEDVDDEVRENMLKHLFTDLAKDGIIKPVGQEAVSPKPSDQAIPGKPTPQPAPTEPQPVPTAPQPTSEASQPVPEASQPAPEASQPAPTAP